MNNPQEPKPQQQASLEPVTMFLRKDLTLLITGKDFAREVQLQPDVAMELAATMILTALEVAKERLAARVGATEAIGRIAAAAATEG